MPKSDEPPAANALEMVRQAAERAKRDNVAQALERMERDDAADGDSFADSSFEASRSESESLDPDSSEAPSKGTLQEPIFSIDSTVELPEDQLLDSEPSLADPAPSSRRGSTTQATLIATPLYRPTRRPPMAVLRVYDDDQQGYEGVRVRQTPFVVGRQDGDLVVGHERQMSRRHARIDRVQEGEVWRWYLGDLRSTNGTFVRVPQANLEDGVEVLMGGELVRFVETATGAPSLVRVAPSDEEERVSLTPGRHLIGTDSSVCLHFLRDSPYLDPQHLRVEYSQGRWKVVDLGSTNNLWVAITKRTELTAGSQFQIGEQRFEFYLP